MLSAINHRECLLCLQDRKKRDSKKRLSSSKKAVPSCLSPMSSEYSCSFVTMDDSYSVEDRWTRANRYIFWYPNYMVTFITNMSYFRPHDPDETPSEALPGPTPILTPESPPSKPVNNSKTLNKKYGTIQRRWTNWEAHNSLQYWPISESVSCRYWLLLALGPVSKLTNTALTKVSISNLINKKNITGFKKLELRNVLLYLQLLSGYFAAQTQRQSSVIQQRKGEKDGKYLQTDLHSGDVSEHVMFFLFFFKSVLFLITLSG